MVFPNQYKQLLKPLTHRDTRARRTPDAGSDGRGIQTQLVPGCRIWELLVHLIETKDCGEGDQVHLFRPVRVSCRYSQLRLLAIATEDTYRAEEMHLISLFATPISMMAHPSSCVYRLCPLLREPYLTSVAEFPLCTLFFFPAAIICMFRIMAGSSIIPRLSCDSAQLACPK